MKHTPLGLVTLAGLAILLAGSSSSFAAPGQEGSASGAAQPKQLATRHSDAPSAAEIAAAKASGKVWVNMSTHIYHRNGRWYGKTKNGKFMTLDEAKKAGYKESHRG